MRINRALFDISNEERKSTSEADQAVALSELDQAMAFEALNAIESDIDLMKEDTARYKSMVDGLDDLIYTCETIKTATKGESALAHIALGLCAAGNEIQTEAVLPGLENIDGGEISTEGLRKVMKKVKDGFKGAIDAMWNKYGEFWKTAAEVAPGIRVRAEKLKERAGGTVGKVATETSIDLGRNGWGLEIDYAMANGGAGVVSGLSETGVLVDLFFDKYATSLGKFASELEKAIKGAKVDDDESLKKALTDAISSANNVDSSKIEKALRAQIDGADKRFDGRKGKRVDLLGNMSIFQVAPSVDGEETSSLLKQARLAQANKFLFMETKDKAPKNDNKGKMATFSPDECIEVADQVIELMTAIENYEVKGVSKTLDTARSGIKTVTKAFSKALKDGQKNASVDSEAKSHADSLLRFEKTYSNWATDIQLKLMKQAISNCRVALDAASKSLSVYKEAGE